MKEVVESTEVFAEPPALPGRWTICAMLFVATSINYMDRQVIGILKPVLAQSSIHLSPLFPGWPTVEQSISMSEQQFGYIVSAFSFAYMVGVIFAGRLVDRLGCRRGYPIVTGLWSLAAMGHALVTSVFGFGVARVFLGLGESGNFPAAIKATAEWFPPKERSLATGIFNSGANVGAILAPAVVPWVALHFGWRYAFLTTGLFSASWILWWSLKYRTPRESMEWTRGAVIVPPPGPELAWWKLLAYRQTWGFALAKFMTDAVWWFYLYWLPSYFNSRFKLDLSHIGLPLIIVYNLSVVGSVGGGWLPRGYERLGLDLKKSRLAAMLTCALLVLPIGFAGGLHFRMERGGFTEPCGERAPGVVGKSVYDGSGNVSSCVRGNRCEFRPGGGLIGRSDLCCGGREYFATDGKLCTAVSLFRVGVPGGAVAAADAGSGVEAGNGAGIRCG